MMGRNLRFLLMCVACLALVACGDRRPDAERIVGQWQTNVTETPGGKTQLFYEFTTFTTVYNCTTFTTSRFVPSCIRALVYSCRRFFRALVPSSHRAFVTFRI